MSFEPMKLQEELDTAGVTIDPEEFKEVLADIFAEMFPGWTDGALMRRPSEARRYCNMVRKRLGRTKVSEHAIMGTLENMRKHSHKSRPMDGLVRRRRPVLAQARPG